MSGIVEDEQNVMNFFFLRKCGIQLYLQNILNYDIWNLSKYGWNCTFRTFSDIILEIFITYCLCHTRIGKTQLVACSRLHIFDYCIRNSTILIASSECKIWSWKQKWYLQNGICFKLVAFLICFVCLNV